MWGQIAVPVVVTVDEAVRRHEVEENTHRWFETLEAKERICRVWCPTEAYSCVCGRAAVGVNLRDGPHALVCEKHKPEKEELFVRLVMDEVAEVKG